MGECLGRERRLRKPGEFQEVFRAARPASNAALVVYALEKPGQAQPRLGLAVSGKVGNAAERNRLKRRLRAVFRRHAASLDMLDAVVVARPAAADLGFDELEEALMKLIGESMRRSASK